MNTTHIPRSRPPATAPQGRNEASGRPARGVHGSGGPISEHVGLQDKRQLQRLLHRNRAVLPLVDRGPGDIEGFGERQGVAAVGGQGVGFRDGLNHGRDYKRTYSLRASALSSGLSKLSFMPTLAERAIEARLAAGYEVPKQWAEVLDVKPPTVYQIESGKTRSLGAKTAAGMARLSGFSIDWLMHGKGPKHVAAKVGEDSSAYLAIPMHSGQASAGHGTKNDDVLEIGSLLFRPRSLTKRDIPEGAAQVWYVTGNSMFPRLREGDAVLFDTADAIPRDGKLYVIEWGKDKQVYVKRLYHELDDAIRVVSDNPAAEFRDRIVQPGDPGFRVLGRVRWIGSWED